ncbi:hypothetical protein VNO80_01009 [Phaseolus coccineus]|uniref:Uncharacterized protein n=1 Tax=Phaseolus coccineus TaxID=3886 RepID=A0AAN9NZD4_PHACN
MGKAEATGFVVLQSLLVQFLGRAVLLWQTSTWGWYYGKKGATFMSTAVKQGSYSREDAGPLWQPRPSMGQQKSQSFGAKWSV